MPRIVDHDARRGELLDGAFELFADRGWTALTMRGIARELGVSTGTLYHYFDGKVAMAQAMYRRRVGRDIARIEATVPMGKDQAETALAVAGYVLDNVDDLQRSLLVGIDFHRQEGEEVEAIVLENIAAYRGVVAERLGLAPDRAALVLSLFFGILVQRSLDPAAVDLPAQLRGLLALIAA